MGDNKYHFALGVARFLMVVGSLSALVVIGASITVLVNYFLYPVDVALEDWVRLALLVLTGSTVSVVCFLGVIGGMLAHAFVDDRVVEESWAEMKPPVNMYYDD